MTFHRLALPSYYIPGGGPLLPSYDLLNDPTTTGGSGIPVVPDPGPKVGGVYDGVYFIADGSDEPANAYNLNRPARAVAESVDLLDDLFNHSVVTPIILLNRTSTSEAVSPAISSLLSHWSIGIKVTNQQGGPLYVAGVRVVVTGTTGTMDGDGFFTTTYTVSYNVTIPAGVKYSIVGGSRVPFKQGLDTGPLSWQSIAADDSFAPCRYDYDITTVSDTLASTGGDRDDPDISGLIDGTSDLTNVALRPGTYTIAGSSNWTHGGRFYATQPGTATIKLSNARVTDLTVAPVTGGLSLQDVSIGTSTILNRRFIVNTDLDYQNNSYLGTVEAGSLELAGAGPAISHRLHNLRLTTNTTLTTSPAGLKVTALAALDMDNCSIEQVPSASTPTAYMLLDTYLGRAHIRNCRIGGSASGVDGLRINAVANTVGRIVFENCNIYHNGTGDAWAVRIINSFGVHFKNCRFFSERGQCVRLENAGATFEECTFESGTDTGLTNAQLVCGEGYVSGNLTVRASFTRCRAIINAANIRATGAPTKPIIELGGRDATANPGPVSVDKFLIEMLSGSLGVHNYTTVVLHGNNDNTEANTYDNVTVDMKSNVPAATGTLAQFMGGFNGYGLVVELVGQANNLRTKARNLQLLNVGAPASAINRAVFGGIYADVDGFVLDGSTIGAGSYSGELVDFRVGTMTCARIFPTAPLVCSAVGSAFSFDLSKCFDLRYHHRASNAVPAGSIFSVGGESEMVSALIYVDQNLTSGEAVISCDGDRSRLRDSFVFLDGTNTGPVFRTDRYGGSAESSVMNNTFFWKNANTNDIVKMNPFSRGTCIGNRLFSSTAFVPGYDYVNATGMPVTANFTTLNTVLSGVLSSAPVVYS